MRINIFYQYLLGALGVILLFSVMLWERSEFIIKESIIDRTYSFLHDKNLSQMKEIDARLDNYLLYSREIYGQLSKHRENFQLKNVAHDIVGADLFIESELKYNVYSTFTNKEFLKNRNLSEDFFKELVGQNPIHFAAAQYTHTWIQKLTAEDGKSDMLALVSRMKSNDQVSYSPYYLVLYIDLKRFNSVLNYDSEYSQILFEPVGGIISGRGLQFDKVTSYPPFDELNTKNINILKSAYTAQETGDVFYFSAAKGNYGYYIATEVKESEIYKPVYILKANYSLAVGILVSLLVIIFVAFALNTLEKKRKIQQQLDSYLTRRSIDTQAISVIIRDELDDISLAINKTFQAVAKVYNRESMIRKFSHTRAVEKLQFKNQTLDGVKSRVLVVKLKLQMNNFVSDVAAKNYFDQRKILFEEIERLAQKSEGVFITMANNTLTYAWGVLEDDTHVHLKGLETVIELNQFFSEKMKDQQSSGLLDYSLSVSYGDAITQNFDFNTISTLSLVGTPVDDLDYLIQVRPQQYYRIVVSEAVKDFSENYFGYMEAEWSPEKLSQDFAPGRRQEYITSRVYLLTKKINEYTEEVFGKV